jgi:hypothetical protein
VAPVAAKVAAIEDAGDLLSELAPAGISYAREEELGGPLEKGRR